MTMTSSIIKSAIIDGLTSKGLIKYNSPDQLDKLAENVMDYLFAQSIRWAIKEHLKYINKEK